MNKRRTEILYFVASVFFFAAAMFDAERNAVFIALGVVFLILSIGQYRRSQTSRHR